MNCLFCDKAVSKPKVYCSNQCQRDLEWKRRKEDIELSGQFVATTNGRVAKRYLKEKYGACCVICFMDSWQGNEMPLVLDHIDGNSDNWKVDNCRLICPNCDTFTLTYKSKNNGNGRHARRLRYQAGKSY